MWFSFSFSSFIFVVLVLYFSTIYSTQSHTDKKETPTKRLRAPPRSAMKEMVEKAQASVSTRMSVVAKL